MPGQSRIISVLNNSGIQQSNPALYQVIRSIIDQLSAPTLVGGTGIVTSTTTIIQQGPSIVISGDDVEEGTIGPPGPIGPIGLTGPIGPAGPVTIGPVGIDGEDGLDGIPIPGPMGPTGPAGASGPMGPVTIGPMGMDGEDGLDGIPIPGPPVEPSEPWWNKVIACAGNGNPNHALRMMLRGGIINPTPTNITTSIARLSYFRLSSPIAVSNIRWYGVGATTGIYHVAVYRHSDGTRITSDVTINTAANTWGSSAQSFSLEKDITYFVAVSVGSTGTTAGIMAMGETISGATTIQVVPSSWPGNLDIDNGFVNFGFAQMAVTSGALPNPAGTISAVTSWTGGMPAIFLDSV